MAKSPRNNDPRAERDDSQHGAGTYVEVVGTPRRRKRATDMSAPKEAARAEVTDASEKRTASKRESVRPAEIAAEQIRLPSGAVAYVSPALPRSSRMGVESNRERSPASAELHLDAPSWVDSVSQDRSFPVGVSTYKAPRAIREVIPRRIEDERAELERDSHPPVEARSSTVESVRPEPKRARSSGRESSIPSESTRPRAVIDCIPDETTQARARLSAVQAALVLASQSEPPPALRASSMPPGSLASGQPAGASVLDAKPQMVSDPPAVRQTSWGLVALVALLCSIISAAAVVALKEVGQAGPAAHVSSLPANGAKLQPPANSLVVSSKRAPATTSPVVEQLRTVALSAPQRAADEPAPSVAQDAVIAAAPTAAALEAPEPAPKTTSAALALAPTATPHAANVPEARSTMNARSDAPRAPSPTSALAPVEIAPLPAALTPGDTKAVLTKLADDERATQRAEERKAEEERKLPSTSRLKAPSVRIEAARIAAALKKASQEAVARANEQAAPAAPATPAKPAKPGDLPDNPF
jgi:hypothetical protein